MKSRVEELIGCWSKLKRRFPVLVKLQNVVHVLQLFAFNVILVGLDVGSDIYTIFVFYRAGHTNWAAATVVPVLMPFFMSTIGKVIQSLAKCWTVSLEEDDNHSNHSPKDVGAVASPSKVNWELPIWHLPFFQLANHFRLTSNIVKAIQERNECVHDLETLLELKLVGKDLVTLLKRHSGNEALKESTEKLSKLESEFLSTKLMEAVFESGPQCILQLSIILKVGNIEGHQAATILISLVAFWFSTTKFLLQMPTKKTPLRSASVTDFAIPFIPTMFVTVSRFAAWSFLLAYLDVAVLTPILIAIIVLVAVQRQHLDFKSKNDVVEVCASVLIPCIAKDEYSRFYATGSAATLTVLLASVLAMILMSPAIDSHPPILTCFDPNGWTPKADEEIRCLYNATTSTLTRICTGRFIMFGSRTGVEAYRTICHPTGVSSSKMERVSVAIGSLIVLLFVSYLLTAFFVQPLIDPIQRLKMIGTWNEFYQTKATDAILALKLKEADTNTKDNHLFVQRVFLSAIEDNIDSLVIHLLNNNRQCLIGNRSLIQAAWKRTSRRNPLMRYKIESSALFDKTGGMSAAATFDVQQHDIDNSSDCRALKLDLAQCKPSISFLRKNLKPIELSDPNTLSNLAERGDSESVKHLLHYHEHLCAKAAKACQTSQMSLGRNSLLSMVIEAIDIASSNQTQNEEEAEEANSSDNVNVIRIQLKNHLRLCKELVQAPPRHAMASNGDSCQVLVIQDLEDWRSGVTWRDNDDDDQINNPDPTNSNSKTSSPSPSLRLSMLCKVVLLMSGVVILALAALTGFLLVTGNTYGLRPIDCTWTPWSDWSPCSKTCGTGGVQSKTRKAKSLAVFGGHDCLESDSNVTIFCSGIPRLCPRGPPGQNLSEDFLQGWRKAVSYQDGNGKALIRRHGREGQVLAYIGDTDHVFDIETRQWIRELAPPSLSGQDKEYVDETFWITPGSMLYIGHFVNGTATGRGIGTLSWCEDSFVDSSEGTRACEGHWLDNTLDGQASCQYCGGRTSYVGGFKNNLRHGQGHSKFVRDDGTLGQFIGQFQNDYLEGQARFIVGNRTTYRGEFHNGTMTGHGRMDYENGDVYVGEFVNGTRHGHGRYEKVECECVYTGQFENDTMTGFGEIQYKDGQNYSGEVLNSLPHGQGKLILANGTTMAGPFVNGSLHGDGGRWKSGVSGIQYTGAFKDGLFHGKGRMEWPDGRVFEGEYEEAFRHGFGQCTYPNGSTRAGFYKNNEPVGIHVMTDDNGEQYNLTAKYDDASGKLLGMFRVPEE